MKYEIEKAENVCVCWRKGNLCYESCNEVFRRIMYEFECFDVTESRCHLFYVCMVYWKFSDNAREAAKRKFDFFNSLFEFSRCSLLFIHFSLSHIFAYIFSLWNFQFSIAWNMKLFHSKKIFQLFSTTFLVQEETEKDRENLKKK